MRFLPVNLDAVLVELDDLPQTLALQASLAAEPLDGLLEVVPAARTLLVRHDRWRLPTQALVDALAARPLVAVDDRASPLVELDVAYDGEDLPFVAEHLGIPVREVIARHTAATYRVAFTGFAPGFGYLTAPVALHVPRRTRPRVRVPAGSVALAGEFSAVYPKDSPGGWQLIGVTDATMWDLARAQPALLQPGFRVRFHDAGRARAIVPKPAARPAAEPAEQGGPALHVEAVGMQALLQDLGRHGHAAQGVSVSGAVDRAALRAANRLVGNDPGVAALEAAGGGLRFTSRGATVVALTGADGPVTLIDAEGRPRPAARQEALGLNDGDRLVVGEPVAGLRTYVAVQGGFDVAPVLGSLATDTLSGVGPPPLAKGTVLPVRRARARVTGPAEMPPFPLPTRDRPVVLDVVPGPRTDWFTPAAWAVFEAQAWTVTPQSNRVGLRLAGTQPLTRAVAGELPSEGTLPGAIQVPPDGQPVLFMADHPLTGGYPVIAAVAPHHLDVLGQVPVGATVRFRPVRAFAPHRVTAP